MKNSFILSSLFTLLFFSTIFSQQISWSDSGSAGMVVAGKPEAVSAGIEILQQGGNAVDAAVSAILVLSIRHIGAFCIGGEVPVLVYDARSKSVKAFSGQGGAPLDPEAIQWFYQNGIPGSSIRAAAVPAVIDLCVTVLQQYGTISFTEALVPSLRILDAGGPSWYRDTSGGDTVETGKDWYSDLAVTFRKLSDAESKAFGRREDKLQAVSNRFYRGDIADELDAWYREKGGFLRKADLIAHRTFIEDPATVTYRGFTVHKCGPWTQGPYLLQALRLLENYDLRKMGLLSADYVHLVTEAMKLAMADRDQYYGDPRFTAVPLLNLLSDPYTRIRLPLIDLSRASREMRPGDPLQMKAVIPPDFPFEGQGGTTTLCVSDRWGNLVAATPSGLGSKAGSAGNTGIIHGARLVSLNTWKGHPNSIEPGKRPRITLTPTLVVKDEKPVLAISVAGGDLQDQVALQLLLDYVDFGMPPEKAFKAPRFSTSHHIGSFGQDSPDLASLRINESFGEKILKQLEKRGHLVRTTPRGIAGPAMLGIDPETGIWHGAGSAAQGIK